MIKSIHLFILFSFISLGLTAQAFDVPALTSPVVDQAGLLSNRTKSLLEQNLRQVVANKGPQVQVLIVSSLQGVTIEEAGIQVFDKWKIGNEKTDDGVLFLISPNDKKLRIEVGRGLEGDIPDAIAKRIVSDTVLPYFKSGEFDMGVIQGVSAILHYANAGGIEGMQQGQVQPKGEKTRGGSKFIGIIIFVFWLLLFMFNPSLALAFLFAGRGGRGGGFGGGGGWSGGGGSSAGGGASGSW